ncbi:LCP family glycopolymer transferase [Paenibacillus pini]|uniref:Cell envelope-associated transcriptional attenuator LytR-CpsA-Psr n=1 Tax=Paenibacillus pini JCM 16418 TaxID=1236976 RepID=W7YK89_9BACL|nr:LCP family protein [Paenibacillus pini]GAF08083.1 cell envelope-associated transcriptional attenuator LytR-CpsA-Psr [Paenibacillus pini JCM 16418]
MKKWIVISTVAFSVLVLGAASYGVYIYETVKSTANQIYEARDPVVVPVSSQKDNRAAPAPTAGNGRTSPTATPAVNMDHKEPFTVLVLGVDQRAHDRGRSDAMILLAVNPEKQKILMFNIPRDTRTEIMGHGTTDKINHAYAFGGVNMSVQTVEHFLDYPINYYVKVNMEGFAKIIDSLGGVNVNNPFGFQYEGHNFAKGELTLNGSEALAFSRMRYDDPRGDMGRNARQREILKQVIQSALKVSNILNIQSVLNEVGDSVRTDITFDDMKSFIKDYRSDIKSIDQVEIQGKGEMINGIWYYMVSADEQKRVHQMLEDHVQKKAVP